MRRQGTCIMLGMISHSVLFSMTVSNKSDTPCLVEITGYREVDQARKIRAPVKPQTIMLDQGQHTDLPKECGEYCIDVQWGKTVPVNNFDLPITVVEDNPQKVALWPSIRLVWGSRVERLEDAPIAIPPNAINTQGSRRLVQVAGRNIPIEWAQAIKRFRDDAYYAIPYRLLSGKIIRLQQEYFYTQRRLTKIKAEDMPVGHLFIDIEGAHADLDIKIHSTTPEQNASLIGALVSATLNKTPHA